MEPRPRVPDATQLRREELRRADRDDAAVPVGPLRGRLLRIGELRAHLVSAEVSEERDPRSAVRMGLEAREVAFADEVEAERPRRIERRVVGAHSRVMVHPATPQGRLLEYR